MLGILGINGSGKSTLLKLICKVIQPTAGTVEVDGKISALLELGAGFNPEISGIENVFFYGSILGFSKSEMENKLDDILSFADIGRFIDQPLKHYSSGMKARLAFAVAISVEPDILVVDEVLAVGDETFRRKCYARIKQFMESGVTILFVTHGVATVVELCSRAILIDRGELIMNGSPRWVSTQYQRLSFAKSGERERVRSELLQLDQDNEPTLKENKFPLKKAAEKTTHAMSITGNSDNRTLACDCITESDLSPLLNPQLESKSKVEYRNYDVDIVDVHVEDLNGEKVNVLVMHRPYFYIYEVVFNLDAENVGFGMRIKSEKGLHISGAATHLIDRCVKEARRGDRFLVKWRFDCNLLPGTYFTNAGVVRMQDGKSEFLNRIVDAVAFQVQPVPKLMNDGLTCLARSVSVRRIDTKSKQTTQSFECDSGEIPFDRRDSGLRNTFRP